MDYYAQVLLDEASTPSNWVEWSAAAEEQCHNASCGDSLAVRVAWQSDVVGKVEWHGQGCLLSQATASIFSREIMGMSVEEVLEIDLHAVQKMLNMQSISPGRVKCVLLFIHCVQRQIQTEEGTNKALNIQGIYE